MSKRGGFTLIEILIALVIFAILATLTSSSLYYAFNTRDRVTQHAQRLVNLQLALSLIERDTLQAVDRSIRGNQNHLFPAFLGREDHLELTRNGFANLDSLEKRSTLVRVALLCRNSQLLRRSWETLDPVDRSRFEDQILLNDLIKCQFHYLNQNLQLLTEWHEEAMFQSQKREPLPKAIQLSLTLKEGGTLSLLFPLPKAVYADAPPP